MDVRGVILYQHHVHECLQQLNNDTLDREIQCRFMGMVLSYDSLARVGNLVMA